MQDLELIESVGIEMEFSSINRKDRSFTKKLADNLRHYRAIHDASCETPIDTFFGIPIDLETDESKEILGQFITSQIIGGEIVSPIINSNAPDWVNDIRLLCDLLKEFGEKEDTVRDSFHVHVNISQEVPLFVLKNLLHLSGHFEMHLYKLGGLGRANRGEENHFIYQRPYLGFGPPCIKQQIPDKKTGQVKTKILPILNFKDLLASESKKQFFLRYGDSIYHADHGTRYCTQRYMSVNFFPILTQGSIEFRTANKCLNPDYIIAWTNFCKAIVSQAFSGRKMSNFFMKYNPLHRNTEIREDYFLESLERLESLDPTTIDVLFDIWNSSPTPYFDNVARYSHLPNPTVYRANLNYYPKTISKNHVKKPNFIDVHVLQNERPRMPRLRVGGINVNPVPAFINERAFVHFDGMIAGDNLNKEWNDVMLSFIKLDNDKIVLDWNQVNEDGDVIRDGTLNLGIVEEFNMEVFVEQIWDGDI